MNSGGYIRTIRNGSKLALTQLACKFDLDWANMSKIENGKRKFDENVKLECFGSRFAKKMYEHNCTPETLVVAEKKVSYMKNLTFKEQKTAL